MLYELCDYSNYNFSSYAEFTVFKRNKKLVYICLPGEGRVTFGTFVFFVARVKFDVTITTPFVTKQSVTVVTLEW